MLARFGEAFVLPKALEAGMVLIWVPLVIMHGAYRLSAYPAGKLSDRVGTRGLLLCGLGFLVAAHLTLAFATSVWVYVLGTLFWGLHMGFSQGLPGAMVAGATPDHLKGSAWLGRDGQLLGAVAVANRPRESSAAGIAALRAEGVRESRIMTGDRRAVGLRIGAEPGFASDEVLADLLPAGKVRLVGDLAPRGKVAFVGDGVNDAAARRCRHHHGCDGQRGRASGRRCGTIIQGYGRAGQGAPAGP